MLTVNTSAIQPSCNNDGQNGDKSNDGLVIATATGGYTPYTYLKIIIIIIKILMNKNIF